MGAQGLASKFVLVALCIAGTTPAAAEEGAWLPFVLPWDDAVESPISAAFLLEAPAGKSGPVTVRDGRFFAGDRRIRFWGVNVCFGACFPEEDAARAIAARMAKFGINCVRFHHMDMRPFPGGIFADRKLEDLAPEALARLDRFFAELKSRGIYVNLNLHVSRWWSRAHGWPGAEELENFDKMLAIFHPELIAAQKKYARDLLGHRNPHTGLTYAEDPAVAMVEITNENSLFMWSAPRVLPRLPEPYAKLLAAQWNAWLAARYGGNAELRKAWEAGASPLGGNLLKDPLFATLGGGKGSAAVWRCEQHAGAAMEAAPAGGGGVVRIAIARVSGTDWHLQFKQERIALEEGKFYTVSFRGRAAAPKMIRVGVSQAHAPWSGLGLSEECALAPEWRSFAFGFTCAATDADCRLGFTVGRDVTAVELADIALRPGGRTGVAEGESLARGSVALFPAGGALSEARARDRLAFLHDMELRYFTDMRAYLRRELGVKAPITGTIAFGSLGTRIQARMDFVDQHAYWQHPHFPRRPWDPRDWTVANIAMSAAADGGCFPHLAVTRVAGLPYTVTEYNHPAPMDSQAETVPMIASLAALQDWDGVFLFTYSHADDFKREKYHGFFDIDANPAKMGFMSAGALLFLGGRIQPAAGVLHRPLGFDEALEAAQRSVTHLLPYLNQRGFQWRELLTRRFALVCDGAGRLEEGGGSSPRVDWRDGRYTVDGPAAKVACGRLAGRRLDLSGLSMEVRAPAEASIVLVARDGAPIDASREMLLVACGRCENTAMGWNAARGSVGAAWGTEPVRIEAVEARITLRAPEGGLRVRRLDVRGRPAGDVPAEAAGGAASFTIGGAGAGLWYLLER